MSHARPLEGAPQENACSRCVLCNQYTTTGKRFCMGPAMFACVRCVFKVSVREACEKFNYTNACVCVAEALAQSEYITIKKITRTCVHRLILKELVRQEKTDLVAKIQATLYKPS